MSAQIEDEMERKEAALADYKAVSYTHLDVYKRQSFGRAISELLASEQLTMPDGLRQSLASMRTFKDTPEEAAAFFASLLQQADARIHAFAEARGLHETGLRLLGWAVVDALAVSYTHLEKVILPDEQHAIEHKMRSFGDRGIALVVTTGGTGFSVRDVTPEATLAVCERLAPGIPEAMRALSMQVTHRAMLSLSLIHILPVRCHCGHVV